MKKDSSKTLKDIQKEKKRDSMVLYMN